jgi:long-chain acyl-CoA synthetase
MRFLRTGDLVWMDEDGYHYVVDRLDDMLVVGGENVYPATIADRLQRHESVRDAAVVSVPHESKGEVPVAFVVADGVSESELQTHAREIGPNYAVPRKIFFKSHLPLTGTGKVDSDELAATARELVGESL